MKQIKVEEKLRDYIQSINYDLDATKDLITYIGSKKPIDTELLKYYETQYKERYIEFETAKSELIKTYGISNNTQWSLDYGTCTLTVED